MNAKQRLQEHKVSGEKLLAKVKELVHQGNVRRIFIKNDDGVTLMELPLTFGVVSALLLPMWVAVGAIAALAANYRIAVEVAPEERKKLAKRTPVRVEAGTAAP